ncbi:pirin family protein [uncultured Alsobacter sp.]|uniref:pirin family protein n=1 Tax=uncultured Alsobacter sp. TaxID=1748258 RepID=UPI0025DFEEC9|nr:pirin family protein [uncultured Alsobacter sp.]
MSVRRVDLGAFGTDVSPVALLDDFRVSGRPFGPHPHAGFSAVTYVFEDSPGSLRSRGSLGTDVVIRPGGLVWLEAASGALHEETPASDGVPLTGAQIYVNLSARGKAGAAATHWLQPEAVPAWTDGGGDRVSILVGTYAGIASPLVPREPFRLLHALVARSVSLPQVVGWNTVIYVRSGGVRLAAGERRIALPASCAVALQGDGDCVLQPAGVDRADVLVLSGPALDEPVCAAGPFIMNTPAQIEAAALFRAGAMGRLELRRD